MGFDGVSPYHLSLRELRVLRGGIRSQLAGGFGVLALFISAKGFPTTHDRLITWDTNILLHES